VIAAETIHASCVTVGEAGILIRGAAGAGKSSLARNLVGAARQAGRFAALVADDRVHIEPAGGRLVARSVAAIAGLIEIRGLGIVPMAHETRALIRFVVDCLIGETTRMPQPNELETIVAGVSLPRLPLLQGANAAPLVLLWLTTFDEGLTLK
jgi:HPr kinase/phosphorylase